MTSPEAPESQGVSEGQVLAFMGCKAHPGAPEVACAACRRRPGWLRAAVRARQELNRREREGNPKWIPGSADENRKEMP